MSGFTTDALLLASGVKSNISIIPQVLHPPELNSLTVNLLVLTLSKFFCSLVKAFQAIESKLSPLLKAFTKFNTPASRLQNSFTRYQSYPLVQPSGVKPAKTPVISFMSVSSACHLTFGGMWRWRRVAVARRAPYRS